MLAELFMLRLESQLQTNKQTNKPATAARARDSRFVPIAKQR